MGAYLQHEKVLEDYKRFLYIVSHDLKAPVRHLEFFTQSFIDSVEDKIKPEEEATVIFINKSLSRLKGMQDALLLLSRVVTNDEKFEKVDSTKIVELAIEELEEVIPSNVVINYKQLPVVFVKPQQFKDVFRNLIKNAVTYNDEKEKTVSILSEDQGGQIKFVIRDNGIGVEEEYREDVFDMFRRLHAEGDYGGGIGAGLTVVKSIIEVHDGQIWIEANEFCGTDVVFTVNV